MHMRPRTAVLVSTLVSSFVFGLAAGNARAEPAKPVIEKIAGEVSAERMEKTIRRLVSFETRNTLSETESDTRGIGAARRWIKSELDACAKANGGRMKGGFGDNILPVAPRNSQPTPGVKVVATPPGPQAESKNRPLWGSGPYDPKAGSPTARVTTA